MLSITNNFSAISRQLRRTASSSKCKQIVSYLRGMRKSSPDTASQLQGCLTSLPRARQLEISHILLYEPTRVEITSVQPDFSSTTAQLTPVLNATKQNVCSHIDSLQLTGNPNNERLSDIVARDTQNSSWLIRLWQRFFSDTKPILATLKALEDCHRAYQLAIEDRDRLKKKLTQYHRNFNATVSDFIERRSARGTSGKIEYLKALQIRVNSLLTPARETAVSKLAPHLELAGSLDSEKPAVVDTTPTPIIIPVPVPVLASIPVSVSSATENRYPELPVSALTTLPPTTSVTSSELATYEEVTIVPAPTNPLHERETASYEQNLQETLDRATTFSNSFFARQREKQEKRHRATSTPLFSSDDMTTPTQLLTAQTRELKAAKMRKTALLRSRPPHISIDPYSRSPIIFADSQSSRNRTRVRTSGPLFDEEMETSNPSLQLLLEQKMSILRPARQFRTSDTDKKRLAALNPRERRRARKLIKN
jgi:hypothetical protein